MTHFWLMMCSIIISFSEKKGARVKFKGRYSSLVFNPLISWSEKIWDFWLNMFFIDRTEGSHKLLATFLSTFSRAAASNSKVSALECCYGTTIQKCCFQGCCLCNRRGILPQILGPKAISETWISLFNWLLAKQFWILITKSWLLHSRKKVTLQTFW